MNTQPVDNAELWAGLPTLEERPGEDDTAPDVWEDPIPLTGRRERPPFPAHVFPTWLGSSWRPSRRRHRPRSTSPDR